MKKFIVRVNGKSYEVEVEEIKPGVSAMSPTGPSEAPDRAVEPPSPPPQPTQQSPIFVPEAPSGSGRITAPMPGVVLKVNVAKGDTVKKGDVLVNLEAMKMENDIFSPVDGKVVSIHVGVGASVNAGDPLVDLE